MRLGWFGGGKIFFGFRIVNCWGEVFSDPEATEPVLPSDPIILGLRVDLASAEPTVEVEVPLTETTVLGEELRARMVLVEEGESGGYWPRSGGSGGRGGMGFRSSPAARDGGDRAEARRGVNQGFDMGNRF